MDGGLRIVTHRRNGLVVALLACAMGVWTSLGVAGHADAGPGPSVVVRAFREQVLRAGEPLTVFVTVESVDSDLKVTLDPLGVGQDGFVWKLPPSNFTFCPDDRGCVPCPEGHRCFGTRGQLPLDYHLVGAVEVPVTVTEGSGRSTRASLRLDLRPATDADADGMADLWEAQHSLSADYRESGPADDPDRDGVTNLDEYRRGTSPRAVQTTYFAEASTGDRGAGLNQCFALSALAQPAAGYPDVSRITLIGDDGRQWEGSAGVVTCPLDPSGHAADRVVAAIVESSVPHIVERMAGPSDRNIPSIPVQPIGVTGVAAPARRWHFADGGTDGPLDTFYLFYNPGPAPTNVAITYRGEDGTALLRRVRRLEPGRRTTVWVNADDAALGHAAASAEIVADDPVLVERAWRFDPPGRTVTQASASPGVAAPSTRWTFPEVDGRSGLETSMVVANPTSREATVDVSILYESQDERRAGALVIRPGGRAAIPARRFAGLAGVRASVELVSRDGVAVVAERTILAHDADGPWRLASPGATAAGPRWVLPLATGQADIVITNVSSIPATVDVRHRSPTKEDDDRIVVTVPARHRSVYRLPPGTDSRVSVSSQLVDGRLADIIVEQVRHGASDGVATTRTAGIIGGRVKEN
jgi:hypothetical protein